MGGGDIKLMAAAGLLVGWKLILLAFFLGCIYGSVIHPIRMILFKQSRVLAFGPYLAAGILTAVLIGDKMIDWYLGSIL
jgi:leader peptidase (prepilin peptidase)/N-methyltransferase